MKKNVLITGAAGNLGKAVVREFLREDYRVLMTVEPGKDPAFEPSENLAIFEADLQDETHSKSFVDQIVTRYKTIDIAVLLVGGFAAGGIDEADGTSVKKMIALNFDTAYFVARPVFQHMLATKIEGRIFVVGARPALYPNEGKDYLAYGLSKSMLFKLAEFLNAAGSNANIVTTVIVPSTIDTPANREAMPKADVSKWVAPAEIARTVAFYCRDENRSLREPILKFFGRK
jgi:NAD(P)-dependent dehydrogenase (short-subunit alcohol dehydrogenase family)